MQQEKQMEKALVGLAGEMRVCAELLRNGYPATITFGNAKATDIIIMSLNGRYLRVEVKTSNNGKKFMTGFFPKYADPLKPHPDLWIFCLLNNNSSVDGDRFFLARHSEVEAMQLLVNKGNRTLPGQGADNIPLKILELPEYIIYENRWNLPADILNAYT